MRVSCLKSHSPLEWISVFSQILERVSGRTGLFPLHQKTRTIASHLSWADVLYRGFGILRFFGVGGCTPGLVWPRRTPSFRQVVPVLLQNDTFREKGRLVRVGGSWNPFPLAQVLRHPFSLLSSPEEDGPGDCLGPQRAERLRLRAFGCLGSRC